MVMQTERDVTVMGIGPMGVRSIARALSRSGGTVTANEPDTSRSERLAVEKSGIQAGSDLKAALAPARLVLACAPAYVGVLHEELFAALGPVMRFGSEQVQAASAVDAVMVGGVRAASPAEES